MNEQKYFDGLITGMKKVIELHKTKDDIRDLENELLKLKHSIYNEDTNKKAKHMKLFEGDK